VNGPFLLRAVTGERIFVRVKNRIAALILRCAVLICASAGVAVGVASIGSFFKAMIYYNMQIAVITAAFFAYSVIATAVDLKKRGVAGGSAARPVFKGFLVVSLIAAGVIYLFLPADAGSGGSGLLNAVVPALVFADWLLFDPKFGCRLSHPFLWVFISLYYYVFAIVRAAFIGAGASRYPYSFMDLDIHGFNVVLVYGLYIAFIFLLTGFLFVFADVALGRPSDRSGRDGRGHMIRGFIDRIENTDFKNRTK